MITHERLKEVLSYDPITGFWLWLVSNKNHIKAGRPAGTLKKQGYIDIQIDGKLYKAHRLAWFYMTGEWPPVQVDHKDLVRSHNWWDNLRLANNSQNKANSRARSDNKLGIKGVALSRGRYRSVITVQGKLIYLGTFDTAEAASAAYAQKALESFGEFSRA